MEDELTPCLIWGGSDTNRFIHRHSASPSALHPQRVRGSNYGRIKKKVSYNKQKSLVMSSVAVNVLTCVVMVLVVFYIGYSEHVDNMNYWIVILIFSLVALMCVGAGGYVTGKSGLSGSGYNPVAGGVEGAASCHAAPSDFMSLSSSSSVGGDTSSVSSFSLSNLSV